MIYVTGDTHIPIDISKLKTTYFPEQKTMSKKDYVIICGDAGIVWDNSNEEKYWQKWLNDKPFTTLFIDGNHENFNLLNNYNVEIWNGGKVHKISDSIIHLMRGQVFNINGLKFFTMGGASSQDKINRVKNISWWENELPTDLEYEEAFKNLDLNNWEVDYVISHCIADSIQYIICDRFSHDKETNFFESILTDVKFKKWFFGHYHQDKIIKDKFYAVYNKKIPLN